jgi:hypothetical protein
MWVCTFDQVRRCARGGRGAYLDRATRRAPFAKGSPAPARVIGAAAVIMFAVSLSS